VMTDSSTAQNTEAKAVRTTLALDDGLLAEAQRLTGVREKSALVREALIALIQRESARRLSQLGGTDPSATAPPRHRSESG
jgi:Arc/MetJ family transcription regulator